jgi:2',3'-cyclic-nucleotide 2'-phosphodiesterase (5'-nucleotidase family)
MKRAFRRSRNPLSSGTLALWLAAGIAVPGTAAAQELCLTILHNNDGESQLVNAGPGLEDFGGAARFARVVRQQRLDGRSNGCSELADPAAVGHATVLLSSGDNFLAGPEFEASRQKGVPFYDSILLTRLRYDAIAIGNHEFDFGPDLLARISHMG